MRADEFRCVECDGVFKKAWSDDEAAAEAEQAFPDETDLAVVCDDCYRALTGQ